MEQLKFLHRLHSLQQLCSDNNQNSPRGILCILGQDGRYHKGSISICKYLFRGEIGKNLTDEILDGVDESLEELVLLIKECSISVIWTHDMKERLAPLFKHIPLFVEYISNAKEEIVMDALQARKCCDFKRLMLSSFQTGDSIGIPVPIGYDSIKDIENWPLVQAFALESVYCPTGFFTSYLNVVDITEHLEILFRTVDGYYVDNAIQAIHRTILPHVVQSLSILDVANEHRQRVTADEFIGPLEMLFEFGELQTAVQVDPSQSPVAYFGEDTQLIGDTAQNSSAERTIGGGRGLWKNRTVGNSLHAVYESCEPCSGLRSTRYTSTFDHYHLDAAIKIDEMTENSNQEFKASKGIVDSYDTMDIKTESALSRLEKLYVKLWISMRYIVMIAFSHFHDVLDAGNFIQENMNRALEGQNLSDMNSTFPAHKKVSGEKTFSDLLSQIVLDDQRESLKVHIDCMNALGEIVSIEDVDDMGGSCWVYIRVSIHGVKLPYSNGNKKVNQAMEGVVAVGDTFLFSPLSTKASTFSSQDIPSLSIDNQPCNWKWLSYGMRSVLLSDHHCMTHLIPYYRCYLGGGSEERSVQRLHSCIQTPHLLNLLRLGDQLESALSRSSIAIPIITDHFVTPFFDQAELRVFSQGFVLEKFGGIISCPMMVSIEEDVEQVWTLDSTDLYKLTMQVLSEPLLNSLASVLIPNGLVILFQLKIKSSSTDNPTEYTAVSNALPRLFMPKESPDRIFLPQFIGLMLPNASSAPASIGAVITKAVSAWRTACRIHDVPDHRGLIANDGIPQSILQSFLTAIDYWNSIKSAEFLSSETEDSNRKRFGGPRSTEISSSKVSIEFLSMVSDGTTFTQTEDELNLTHLNYVTIAQRCIQNSTNAPIGLGYSPLRCTFLFSEMRRLHPFDHFSLKNVTHEDISHIVVPKRKDIQRKVVLMCGHPGSGVVVLASNLKEQLNQRIKSKFVEMDADVTSTTMVSMITIDFEQLVFKDDRVDTLHKFSDLLTALERDQQERIASNTKPSSTCIITIVCCITSPTVFIQPYMLKLWVQEKLKIDISSDVVTISVLSVPSLVTSVNDDGIEGVNQSERLSQDSLYGIGQEFWKSSHIQYFNPDFCNIAVAVDEDVKASKVSGLEFTTFRNYLTVSSPNTLLLKISPRYVRLDDETVDYIFNALLVRKAPDTTSTPLWILSYLECKQLPCKFHTEVLGLGLGHPTMKQILLNNTLSESDRSEQPFVIDQVIMNHVMNYIIPPSVKVYMQSFRANEPVIATTSSISTKNFAVLIRQLFPAAIESTAAMNQDWIPPNNKKKTHGFKRLLELARSKVIQHLENEENAKFFQQEFSDLLKKKKKAVDSMTQNVRSIHGILMDTYQLQGDLVLYVEACKGHVLYRSISMESVPRGLEPKDGLCARLTVNGCFQNDGDERLFSELLKMCIKRKLRRKDHLRKGDIDRSTRIKLQNDEKYKSIPLPGGCWYDGNEYLDVNGTRSSLRPDIDVLLKLYIEEENLKIDQYNLLIDY